MSRDQKVMTLQPPMEKCPMDFYQRVVPIALIIVAPVTRGKRNLSKSRDYEVMTSLPPEAEYPMEPFI